MANKIDFSIRSDLRRTGYMPRYKLVREIMGGVGKGIDRTLPRDLVINCKSRLSLAVRSAIDEKTGRIMASATSSVSAAVYSQLLQMVGHDKARDMKLSKENIESILKSQRLIVSEELDLEIEKKSKNFMKALLEARTLRDVWELIPRSINDIGVALGVGVYEVNSETGEICGRFRIGLKGRSRVENAWGMPTGEKGYFIYINDLVAEKWAIETGETKVKLKMILERLGCEEINRFEWSKWGLNRQIMQRILDQCGLKDVSAGMFAGQLSIDLVQKMVEMMRERICLTDDIIDTCGARLCREFEARIESKHRGDASSIEREKKALLRTYEMTAKRMKEIAKSAVKAAFTDKERKKASEDELARNRMSELNIEVNGADASPVFEKIAHFYSEAQYEIEADKERLGISGKGIPDSLMGVLDRNLYYVVRDQSTNKVIALVLANNHEASIKERRKIPMFEGQESIRNKFINALQEISMILGATIALKIQERESQRDKEQAENQARLLTVLTNPSISLKTLLSETIGIIQKLFIRDKADQVEISVMLSRPKSRPEDAGIMDIVAATKIDRDTGKPISGTVNIEKPTSISGWVALKKEGLFISFGKAYKNGKLMSQEELDELKNLYPEVYAEMEKISRNINNTCMIVPLMVQGEEHELAGVVNVSGARMTKKDMNILGAISDTIYLAIDKTMHEEKEKALMEQLKAKTDELSKLNLELRKSLNDRIKLLNQLEVAVKYDELTKLLRRSAMEEKLRPAIESTRKMPGDDMAILMIDIDFFKKINDTLGHEAGDKVLAAIAALLKTEFGDVVVRYGGEEILVWLPHHTKTDANVRGQEILQKIFQTVGVTVSIGISGVAEDYEPDAVDPMFNVIDKADKALRGAKKLIGVGRTKSRNQCWVYTPDVGKQVEEWEKKEKEAIETVRKVLAEMQAALDQNNIELAKTLLGQSEAGIEALLRS